MSGIVTFSTLRAALDAGFMILDRTSDGYRVQRRGPHGFEMAFVILKGQ
jgi:hypothetical protein